MKRRSFIKKGALWLPALIAPTLLLPRKTRAQVPVPFGFIGAATSASGGGGACSTARDAFNPGTTNSTSPTGVTIALGSKFVAGGSYTICKAEWWLASSNSPTENFQVLLYKDSDSSQVGTGSDLVNAATISSTPGYVTFSNISATLVSGTAYFCGLYSSAIQTAPNVILAYYDTSASESTYYRDTSWHTLAAGNAFKFRLFSS